MAADLEVIALVGRETLYKILGISQGEPDERRQAQWLEVAEIVNHYCQNEIETTFTDLAQKAHKAYGGRKWDDEPELIQLTWNAVVRQMVNMLTAEGTEDLAEINNFDWRQWVAEKLTKEDHERAHSPDRDTSPVLS